MTASVKDNFSFLTRPFLKIKIFYFTKIIFKKKQYQLIHRRLRPLCFSHQFSLISSSGERTLMEDPIPLARIALTEYCMIFPITYSDWESCGLLQIISPRLIRIKISSELPDCRAQTHVYAGFEGPIR